jgi:hypothetical protein
MKNLNSKAVDEVFAGDELEVWEQTPEEKAWARALEDFGKGKSNHQKIDIYSHDLNEKDYLGQW